MEKIKRPSITKTFTEVARGIFEYMSLQATLPLAKALAKEGTGQPVLVLPGFGLDDNNTRQLREFLDDKNNCAYGWGNGKNLRFNASTAERLIKLIDEIRKEHDGAKINLVGHSLGGILAREMARDMPGKINQVITMGSPFGCLPHRKSTMFLLRNIIGLFNSGMGPIFKSEKIAKQLLSPPPVPTTSIYSRDDGVVNWRTCSNPLTKTTENIEVKGSHLGLVFNPVVMFVIADRLAQPQGSWEPFATEKYFSLGVSDTFSSECLLQKRQKEKDHYPFFSR